MMKDTARAHTSVEKSCEMGTSACASESVLPGRAPWLESEVGNATKRSSEWQRESDGESVTSQTDGEPPRKRRSPDREALSPATSHDELDIVGNSSTTILDQSACMLTKPISRETPVSELPNPAEVVSPDTYLFHLVKAMCGVSLEVKPALSLESFFQPVSEDQMSAYNVDVVRIVRNNDLDGLKKLYEEGQRLDCFNRFGESLLNMACRRGFEDIAKFLLDEHVDVRICDDGGRTPLHDACWNPSPQLGICKWLLQRDPSLFFIADRRGCSAFEYARPEHWIIWRKFLFENRECLHSLTQPGILSRLAKD